MSFRVLLENPSEAEIWTAGVCTRLGRAFGTLLRRNSDGGARRVLVGRTDDAATVARDGLVRGLILAGHTVEDFGALDTDAFTVALAARQADGGVLVKGTAPHFWIAREPLGSDALAQLGDIADGQDFATGTGSLAIVDRRAVRP